jgi:hypothetical protein
MSPINCEMSISYKDSFYISDLPLVVCNLNRFENGLDAVQPLGGVTGLIKHPRRSVSY